MRACRFDRLSDHELLRVLAAALAQERVSTATVVACIAEIDSRRLFVPAGYSSLYQYCVSELRLSEESAYKRIHAARAARRFPRILVDLAEGRLHLSGVLTLAPYLAESTAADLLDAAAGKTRNEIELLLAQRFPKQDVPERVTLVTSPAAMSPPADLLTPAPADQHAPGRVEATVESVVPSVTTSQHAPGRVEAPAPRPRVAPLAPERFALQLTITQSTHDKLRYAQELLGKASAGDLAEVLDQALDALIVRLEKRKFAATSQPRLARPSTNPRHVPADVKRAVRKRDQGRCTFVADDGHRCDSRRDLQFDHIIPVARGGRSTVDNLRLRCRAHNLYEAERVFGAGFMQERRRGLRGRRPSEILMSSSGDRA